LCVICVEWECSPSMCGGSVAPSSPVVRLHLTSGTRRRARMDPVRPFRLFLTDRWYRPRLSLPTHLFRLGESEVGTHPNLVAPPRAARRVGFPRHERGLSRARRPPPARVGLPRSFDPNAVAPVTSGGEKVLATVFAAKRHRHHETSETTSSR